MIDEYRCSSTCTCTSTSTSISTTSISRARIRRLVTSLADYRTRKYVKPLDWEYLGETKTRQQF